MLSLNKYITIQIPLETDSIHLTKSSFLSIAKIYTHIHPLNTQQTYAVILYVLIGITVE